MSVSPALEGIPWSYGILALSAPFVLTYLVTTLRSWLAVAAARKTEKGLKRPPQLPTAIPFVGHIIQFLGDANKFLGNALQHFEPGTPTGINMVAFSAYYITGKEAISAYLKDPHHGLTQTSRSRHLIEHAFGCPHEEAKLFGPLVPDVETQRKMHSNLHEMVSGPTLEKLGERFQEYFVDQIVSGRTGITDEWTEVPDLCAFVEKHVLEAAVKALFGPIFIEQNPDFADHFAEFNRHLKSLFMSKPRWLVPAAYRARDTIHADVVKWQKYVSEHCNPDDVSQEVGWEEHYGARLTRVRQQLMTKRGIVHPSARAAENLANIWVSNANSVPAAVWFLLEALFDPSLQKRVQKQLTLSKESAGTTERERLMFDINKLTNDDLLQSVYAETLRLRSAVMLVRQPREDNFSIAGWHIKKHEVVSLSTGSELRNPTVWNAGTRENPHPLDQFWGDRFMVDPKDPRSGPLRDPKPQKTGRTEPYFSLEGATWNWIPYGGGRNLCPGRYFAKREIMLTSAILFEAFEFDVLTDKKPVSEESLFGFGTMPTKGKVPCRIRRRRQ